MGKISSRPTSISKDSRSLDHGEKVGCTTVLFTDRYVRSAGPRATIELYTYRGEPRAYHSMASAVALVDALVVGIAAQLDGAALETLDRIKELKRAYGHLLAR